MNSRKQRRTARARNRPAKRRRHPGTAGPALLFDLDGTLVDSVYDHVLAWHPHRSRLIRLVFA